jgi:quinol monooxygenase YgiN
MELFIFARFHALDGQQAAVASAIREVAGPTRVEPGCVGYAACHSDQDPQLFWIYSRWADDAAFETHARLPHTVQFIERMQTLVDGPLDISHARSIL